MGESRGKKGSSHAGCHGLGSVAGKAGAQALARYGVSDSRQAAMELSLTAVPFLLLWSLALYCLDHHGYWACLIGALPAACFLIRLFLIQHDCGHGSFFGSRKVNDGVGRLISILTLVPYGYWRRAHSVHHATSGNLDRRGIGDVLLLTLAEYRALPRWRRIGYRLSRNPAVLFVLGPLYLFVLKYRLPIGFMQAGKDVWISVMATNITITGFVVVIGGLVGVRELLIVHLTVTLLAGSAGIGLFFVQHQFETTYWARQQEWNFHDGALLGATHYDLPVVLRWLTANIGIHHVHHLASRIPFYRLPEVLADHPVLRELNRCTLRESLSCFRLALWDEEEGRLVPFRHLRDSPDRMML